MNKQKVWYITGASKGFGLSLVKQLLNAGQLVAATSRNTTDLINAVNTTSANFLPLQVDLGNEESVNNSIQNTIQKFNRVDVVINNAGYGIGGSIEELTDAETRDSFNVNVFGMLNVIRLVMPQLRAQRSGHIINIASIAGIAGGIGWSIYAATKFAVVGLTEVLALDVQEFGIKATVVAPGTFRTSFLTPESLIMAKDQIGEYSAVRASHNKYLQMDGQQNGDPEKGAAAIIAITELENPPLHLLLGNDAYTRAMDKLDALEKEFIANEALSRSMAYSG